jgi:hypothetical protein
MERHFNALDSNKYDADFPPKSEIRELNLKELKLKSAACSVAHTHGNVRVDLERSSRCFGQNEESDVIHAHAH